MKNSEKIVKIVKALLNMVLPSLIFFVVYKLFGIIPAIAASLVYGIAAIIVSAVRGKVKNTQIIGLLGLIGSAVAIYFTGEEKYYYVPALIENVIFLGFMVFLSIRRKSVFHYIAKDFEIESLQKIPEDRLMSVNIVWILFFVLKIVAKVIGILYLNFQTLYWLVFILGDPMTVVAVILSIILIRRSFAVAAEDDD